MGMVSDLDAVVIISVKMQAAYRQMFVLLKKSYDNDIFLDF